jgi:MoaA/NifB/PqqE/SkfB family radical SAM enzyme
VKYEAEVTVPALLASWRDEGRRPSGAYRGSEVELATLPPPAWDLVDLTARDAFQQEVVRRAGRGAWPFPLDGRTLPLVTSRGCPYSCLHCSSNPGREPGEPKTQRRLPPARLAALVETLVVRHRASRLLVLDELLNASESHLDALLDAVETHDVPFDAPNGVRADRLRGAQIGRMRGRITTLSVSAESGVQRVVDEVVGKRLDLGEVTRVARQAQACGIPLLVHYIIGLPGETAAEINGTLAHALELHERFGAEPAVQFATPLPGTRLAATTPPLAVEDFGPCFQARPSPTNSAVPPEALGRFRRAFERRLRARASEKLILNLTYRCNNRCAFCAVGNRVRMDGEPARQHALLEEHRRRGVRLVDFDGGEPTLHAELLALVGHAAALGYERIAVTTNGRRCSYPAFAARLARSGVTTVLVSLHGPDAAVHGALVGVPDAFDQTVAGIRNLVRFSPGGLELGINATVVRGNAERLEELAALAWELGVRWLNFQFLTPFGRATRDQAPDLPAAAARVGRIADSWRAQGARIGIVNLPFCFLPGHEELVAPDVGKLGRQMVFANDEEVNLGAYLAARRVRRSECAPCPWAICCGGFYDLDEAPEPPWLGGAAGTGTNSASPKRST